MSKPATAIVIPYRFYPPKNGGQHAAAGFTTALGQTRPLLVLTTPDNDLGEQELPFQIEPIFRPGIGRYLSPVKAWEIARLLNKNGVREVILFQPFPGLLFLPLVWLGRIQLSVYLQNLEYQRFRSIGKWWWPLMFIFEWLIFLHSKRLYFISPDELPIAKRIPGLGRKEKLVVPFGTWLKEAPNARSKSKEIRQKHRWSEEERLLLFFGPQTYLPNLLAVQFVVEKIMPELRKDLYHQYRFIICGGGLSEELQNSALFQQEDISYLGFVPEIEPYILAADVVLNPIDRGGGVKTKVIEAIALGKTVLSFNSGALGVNRDVAEHQLQIVDDGDIAGFLFVLREIFNNPSGETSEAFYDYYHWPKIVERI